LLREDGEREEPHRAENAEERSEWTEGRTLVHQSNDLGSRAEEVRHPHRASFPTVWRPSIVADPRGVQAVPTFAAGGRKRAEA
jgi:hypothetical protein